MPLPPRVYHCLVAALEKAKASGENPEDKNLPLPCGCFGKSKGYGSKPRKKSGVGDPKAVPCVVYNLVLASPATVLVPKCNSLLFLWIHWHHGEGGHAAWATSCPPYPSAQAWIPPMPSLKYCTTAILERTLQLRPWRRHNTGSSRYQL